MTTKENLFLITGATGNTGTPTVKLLCDAGHRVRAFVHDVDERSTSLEELGAEVVAADFLDFDAVSSAMAGVTAAYFCYPVYPGGLLQATAVFAQAASEAGVHAVVNMSQISARREATSNAARQHWLAERLLDRTTMVTTHLRPTFFAELINWFWVRRRKRRRASASVRQRPPRTHLGPRPGERHRRHPAESRSARPADLPAGRARGTRSLRHRRKVQQTLGIPVRYDPVTIPTFAGALTALGTTPFFCAAPEPCRPGLPGRHLRRHQQPGRGHRRQQADDRRRLRGSHPRRVQPRRPPRTAGCAATRLTPTTPTLFTSTYPTDHHLLGPARWGQLGHDPM